PEQKDEKTPAKEPKSSQNTTPHTTPNKTQATGVSEKVATAPSFEPSIHKPVKKLPQRTIRQTARRASQTNTGPKYALHVSSHSIVSSAKREAKRLKAQGYTVTIVETNIPQKGIFHRILIGDYATKANAKKALGDVKASLNVGFVQIRPLPAKHLNLARSNNSSVPQTR
ncbi:MAG: SPOR domain-containing protein, partial [Candidatus Latescibacteria bacterium]|nr:SPOR domain-containing protein [Candidatus Latescibacterota bacterium]